MAKEPASGNGSRDPDESGETPDNILIWHHLDPEARLGFRAGRFTDANALLSGLVGLLLTVITFAGLCLVRDSMP